MGIPPEGAADRLSDLRHAVQAEEIVPYFQPLVCLRTGQVAGFEMLARWPHRSGATVQPGDFIPLSERRGLIDALTDSLLRQSFTAAAGWRESVRLAVNLAPSQFLDRKLPDRLRALSEQIGFPIHRLLLEITENAAIDTIGSAQAIINDLKGAGAHIALDDFGTGFSSLRRLQALPVDTLKVDASFIRSMTYRRDSRKIVAAVIGLGFSLGLSTVAEGVETREQADMLKAMGCDLGQGWWFGRPVPADEATRGLNDGRWTQRATDPSVRFASEMAARLEASPGRRLAELNALYDGAPVGLALLDNELRYVSLNRRLAEMHGVSVAEHIGRSVAELKPELFHRIGPWLRRAQQGQAVTNARLATGAADTDGEERLYIASYYPVRDEADEVVGISVAVVEAAGRADAEPAAGRAAAPAALDPRLTDRQSDVLRLVAQGRSIKEIADSLGLGIGTVKTHLSRIYRLLGARNRVEAVARAGLTAASPGRR